MKKIVFTFFWLWIIFAGHVHAADPFDHRTWSVIPNHYQYSMTVTSVLVFGTDESRDMNDKITAFVGNECRGIAKPITYIPSDNRYIANLIVYSNETHGEKVTIYMYDASKDKVVEVSVKLDFSANATYGRPDDPYFSLTTYSIELLIQAGNHPVAGALVELADYGIKETNTSGNVLFMAVIPGDSLNVSVMSDNYDLLLDTLKVSSENVKDTLQLTLSKTYQLRGLDNAPLDSAQVELENKGSTISNHEGMVKFSGLTPGSIVDLTVYRKNYDTLTATDTILPPTGQTESIVLTFTTYQVKFIIKDAGKLMKDAKVELEGYGTIITNSTGVAIFASVIPAKRINLLVSADNYNSFSTDIDVSSDLEIPIDLTLTTYPVTININNGELPIENSKVVIEGYGTKFTDIYGNVYFPDVLIDNKINYSVWADGYHSTQGNINVLNQAVIEKVTMEQITHSFSISVNDGINKVVGANVTLNMPGNSFIEDFNQASLPYYFNTSGNNTWKTDKDNSFMGINSAGSGFIYDNQNSVMELQKITQSGEISFFLRVSSEDKLDYLIFYIDNVEKGRWSGETGWKQVKFPVTKGNHIFKWEYRKDVSKSEGSDKAWVDFIKIPSESNIAITKKTNNEGISNFENLISSPVALSYTVSDERFNQKTDSVIIENQNGSKIISLDINLVFKVLKEFNSAFQPSDSVWLENYGKVSIGQDGYAEFKNIKPNSELAWKVIADGFEEVNGKILANVNSCVEIYLKLTSFPVAFNIMNGELPVENSQVTLEGYGTKTSDVYGNVNFSDILIGNQISYTVAAEGYHEIQGKIDVLNHAVAKKITLERITHSATIEVNDGFNPVEGVNVILNLPGTSITEDFDQAILPDYVKSSGNNIWTVDQENTFMGVYSASSGFINHNQNSVLEFQKNTQSGEISFYLRVSSEEKLDYLIFYIDNLEKGRWSGEKNWLLVKFPVDKGNHMFKWEYRKDGSTSEGVDKAWIDYIKFPSDLLSPVLKKTDKLGKITFDNLYPSLMPLEYQISDDRYVGKTGEITITDKSIHEVINMHVNLVFELSKEFKGEFITSDSVWLENFGKAVIDKNGKAVFSNIQPQTNLSYKIHCSGYNLKEGRTDVLVNTTIKDFLDQTRYAVKFKLKHNNQPIHGLLVELDGYESKISDSQGEVVYESIIPANLSYKISHDDYEGIDGKILVKDNDLILELEILPYYTLDLKITSATATGGVPVPGALVLLNELGLEKIGDHDGRVVFEKLTPGNLSYKVIAKGYMDATGTISVQSNTNSEISLNMTNELKASNLITPNGDLLNDYWEIFDDERIVNFYVRIFSSEGEKIFETNNYPGNKWDGKYKGKLLAKGVYFYIVTSPDNSMMFKGIINLNY